jgi:hypothetical protein
MASERDPVVPFLATMNPSLREPQSYDFYFPPIDTLVRVEQADNQVVIRATRDTFSARRKASFIRELAAEGFIPDHYYWFNAIGDTQGRTIRWSVDLSWLKISPELTAATRRFVLRLFGSATLLWVALMAMVFLRADG